MEIDVQTLASLLAKSPDDVLLVDVRQQWEHDTAQLPRSQLVPLHELPQRVGEIQPKAGQKVVCYCHHGMRSLRAAAFLRQAGLSDALSLRGGIDAWSKQVDPKVPTY